MFNGVTFESDLVVISGGSTPRAELNGADSGGRSEVANLVGVRKANWHQYVWVTQLQSVVVCHNIWRPAINLMLDYCRHSFISGSFRLSYFGNKHKVTAKFSKVRVLLFEVLRTCTCF